jgi:hypothetical protein
MISFRILHGVATVSTGIINQRKSHPNKLENPTKEARGLTFQRGKKKLYSFLSLNISVSIAAWAPSKAPKPDSVPMVAKPFPFPFF